MSKTAIIIGATGLVGSNLLQDLLLDDHFSHVKIFVRKKSGIVHQKLHETIIDFNSIELVKKAITGDVLFSCLGTTIKQAGSKKNQFKVDFTYQYEFAKHACEQGVTSYVLISSTSAHPNSMFFYSRIKGALEASVKQLDFDKIRILQPGVLKGERIEKRTAEVLAAKCIDTLGNLFPFLKKYRSISGKMVAKAMIAIYKKDDPDKIKVYKLDELFFQ